MIPCKRLVILLATLGRADRRDLKIRQFCGRRSGLRSVEAQSSGDDMDEASGSMLVNCPGLRDLEP